MWWKQKNCSPHTLTLYTHILEAKKNDKKGDNDLQTKYHFWGSQCNGVSTQFNFDNNARFKLKV